MKETRPRTSQTGRRKKLVQVESQGLGWGERPSSNLMGTATAILYTFRYLGETIFPYGVFAHYQDKHRLLQVSAGGIIVSGAC